MKHDISKLKPIHQQMYKEFLASEYTPNEVPDELYQVYLAQADPKPPTFIQKVLAKLGR